MSKNSWVCILVAKFSINYTCFEFLDDKYIKNTTALFFFYHLACFRQATPFNYRCPSGTDKVMEYLKSSLELVMHLDSSSFCSGSGLHL